MEPDFREIQQRVRRYWFKDGLGEMVVGGLFILLAAYVAGHQWLPVDSKAPLYLDGGLVLILLLGIFLTTKLINIFKQHITYPRTGYVEYYPTKKEKFLAKIFIFASFAGFVILIMGVGEWVGTFRWLPGFLGALIALALMAIRPRVVELNRFYRLAGVALLAGIGASLLNWLPQYSVSLFFALFGCAMLVTGALTLRKYLRENPLPTTETADER
ncbi:MAG: hypothetical protein IT310_02275 [Anaerolineales bacterium]|nr:hypothetical protein [Anaerolineales bacterium]